MGGFSISEPHSNLEIFLLFLVGGIVALLGVIIMYVVFTAVVRCLTSWRESRRRKRQADAESGAIELGPLEASPPPPPPPAANPSLWRFLPSNTNPFDDRHATRPTN